MAALVGGVSAAIGLALALPAAAFYSFPTRRRTVFGGDEPIDVGAADSVVAGQPLRVNVRAPIRRDAWTRFTDVPLGACWLVRDGADVRALSTVCPHAGCAVDWDATRRAFACPCHDSTFATTGERLSGPAPRPLDTLETQLVDGRVRVQFRRFRTATSDKEPI